MPAPMDPNAIRLRGGLAWSFVRINSISVAGINPSASFFSSLECDDSHHHLSNRLNSRADNYYGAGRAAGRTMRTS
jgi:hypothetical protein